MTDLQVKYQALQEERRANLAQEALKAEQNKLTKERSDWERKQGAFKLVTGGIKDVAGAWQNVTTGNANIVKSAGSAASLATMIAGLFA